MFEQPLNGRLFALCQHNKDAEPTEPPPDLALERNSVSVCGGAARSASTSETAEFDSPEENPCRATLRAEAASRQLNGN
jgi:hypothetical protein